MRIKTFISKEEGLALDGLAKSLGSGKSGTLHLSNRSEAGVTTLAQEILASGVLPENTGIVAKTEYSFWRINEGSAEKVCQISSKSFSKEEGENPRLELSSANFPGNPLLDGWEVVSYWEDFLQRNALKLKNLQAVEWRYEGIHVTRDVDFVLKELTQRGLSVGIQPPYVLFGTCEDKLYPRQSISVRIPSGTDKKESSDRNVVKKECSLEKVLEKIVQEVALVQIRNSLVKRYAGRVEILDETSQQELLRRLQSRGYRATLDAPFLTHATEFGTQYVLIDLP